MSNVIDTRIEPPVFDVKENCLSATWIDWHVYGQMIQSPIDSLSVLTADSVKQEQYLIAVKVGNEKLEQMVQELTAADDHCWGSSKANLTALLIEVRGYLATAELIKTWDREGYLNHIALDAPSIFVPDDQDVFAVRDAAYKKSAELGVPASQFPLYGASMGRAITAITRTEVLNDTRVYQLDSSVKGVPSLLWVLQVWASNPEMSYGDAHKHSVSLMPETKNGEQAQ